jgi:hypothetical protein
MCAKNALQYLSVISRRMRWVGHVEHMGNSIGAYRVLVGKSEGKRPLGRPRHKLVITSKWILRNSVGRTRNGLIWLKAGKSYGLF